MAQRILEGLAPFEPNSSRTAPLREPENQKAIPAGSGYFAGDHAQRSVVLMLILVPVGKNFNDNIAILETSPQFGSWWGQAQIVVGSPPRNARRLARRRKKTLGCSDAKILL